MELSPALVELPTHRLGQYLEKHRTVLNHFASTGWIAHHTIDLLKASETHVFWAGEIACQGNIVLMMSKLLMLMPPSPSAPTSIQPEFYSYNASVRGYGNILRYDNQHRHAGHADEFHAHRFDWKTSEEQDGSPEWIGVRSWPKLSDVLTELQVWHSENYAALGSFADSFVPREELSNAEQVAYRH